MLTSKSFILSVVSHPKFNVEWIEDDREKIKQALELFRAEMQGAQQQRFPNWNLINECVVESFCLKQERSNVENAARRTLWDV